MDTVILALVREVVQDVATRSSTPESMGGRMPVKTGQLVSSLSTRVYRTGNSTIGEVTYTAPYAGLINRGGAVIRTYNTKNGPVDKEVTHTPKSFLDAAVVEAVDMEKMNTHLRKKLQEAQNIDIKTSAR
tara:strand:+ start:869 stop:1258 length:390 start_codon:yes stop_codon:yes gene_type:complete